MAGQFIVEYIGEVKFQPRLHESRRPGKLLSMTELLLCVLCCMLMTGVGTGARGGGVLAKEGVLSGVRAAPLLFHEHWKWGGHRRCTQGDLSNILFTFSLSRLPVMTCHI